MTESELLSLISRDKDLMFILKVIAELGLKDAWLAADAVRNFIWNVLSGRPAFDKETDIDVVFFDNEKSYEETLTIEQDLNAKFPQYRWEVRNQIDMHQHSTNTAPYQSTCDAISKYPERCTSIAVRLNGAELELFAPYGLEDIVNFVVRPTPHFLADEERMVVYRKRIAKKTWFKTWSRLRIVEE